MSLPAELLDDLRAVRRGEKPFDSVALKISSHLTSWPDSAEEVLRQVQNALDQQIIEPDQFDKLRALIKPKPGGFDDLPWMTDLWEARKKAADEGKPLLVWVGDGHPLGWT